MDKIGKKLLYLVIACVFYSGWATARLNQPRSMTRTGDTLLTPGMPQVAICFDDGYQSVYQYAFPRLKKYKTTATVALVSSKVLDANRGSGSANLRYGFMNKAKIQEMIKALGIEVASHSVSHCSLTAVTDSVLRKYEMVASKQILESLFGQNIITFVYPYGKYDDQIIRFTAEAGYRVGRTCEFGEPNFWVESFKVPIKEIRSTTTIQEIIDHLRRFDQTILVFHRILPKPLVFTEFSVARFDSLLAVLQQQKFRVSTIRGMYDFHQKVIENLVLESGLFDRNYWQKYLFQKIDIDLTGTPPRF